MIDLGLLYFGLIKAKTEPKKILILVLTSCFKLIVDAMIVTPV